MQLSASFATVHSFMCTVQGTCSIKLVLYHARETADLWYGGLG